MNLKKRIVSVVVSVLLCMCFSLPCFAVTKDDALDVTGLVWETDSKGFTFLFDEYGQPVSGWVLKDDAYYYFGKNGVMKTGWIKYKKDGNWYYLYQKDDDVAKEDIGKMAVDTWIDNYKVDKDGAMVKTR